MEMGSKREIEIKLALESASEGRRLLRRTGFRVVRRRIHEDNLVFDTLEGRLRRTGLLLRLRLTGHGCLLTFKGPAAKSKHKSRLELEIPIQDQGTCRSILAGLGFNQAFRYEKFRTEFQGPDRRGLVTLDETPVGPYLELEGDPHWIEATARRLGFSQQSYISDSYGDIYWSYCRRLGRRPGDMVFPASL